MYKDKRPYLQLHLVVVAVLIKLILVVCENLRIFFSLEGKWSEKWDAFSYSVILFGLITNRVYAEEDVIDHKIIFFTTKRGVGGD